ncbi:ATP cone domain-containing protein [Aequorivita sp. SDUM287046]|uniref:ATP cone domain-containing protein n=1 Tax=Aequorivita aurantiaca TaxID=3053356 RepID=A0ABT8DF20_9FLAO|nr:ATP cone domain-containing protein [Aequorivita aurantiaca]MDN3723932.1 ATP cone domain-containing protein [Aequorivita aurantiaca]
MEKTINIIKYSGEVEAFNIEKLKRSLRHSKASEQLVTEIAEEIQAQLTEGITTKRIYEMAYGMLKRKSKSGSARYKLKKAIMELGPTGYPFERFVGKILEYEGFKTNVGVVMQGHCVTHEVDVTALKAEEHYLVECKFHNHQGRNCNVKTPLYVQSRFRDLETQWLKNQHHSLKFHKGWLYTNTRFSADAIQFGECAGLGMVSWDYPEQNSLKSKINLLRLYPITALPSLSKQDKQKILNNDIVLCKEICDNPKLLDDLGISTSKRKRILKEANELCNH